MGNRDVGNGLRLHPALGGFGFDLTNPGLPAPPHLPASHLLGFFTLGGMFRYVHDAWPGAPGRHLI